jgi:hypothetical protein
VFFILKSGVIKQKWGIWFDFEQEPSEDYKNFMLNPFRLNAKIKYLAKKARIKMRDMNGSDEPLKELVVEYTSDISGTIGDKLNIGKHLLGDIVHQAYKEEIAEMKKYLNALSL